MRLLLDIDIILDVLLDRAPWVGESAQLLSAVERREVSGADYIATRNERDFQGLPIAPHPPGALLAML